MARMSQARGDEGASHCGSEMYLFFDVGGTLLDVSCGYSGALQTWTKMGADSRVPPDHLMRKWMERSEEFVARFEEIGVHTIFDAMTEALTLTLNEFGVSRSHDTALAINKAAWRAIREGAKPFPDVTLPLFQQLKSLGYQLGIITDVDEDVASELLPRIPGLELFSPVVCSWELGVTKPDSRIFRRALAISNCPVEKSIFIGDAPTDIKGASSVGMRSVVVDRSGTFRGNPSPDLLIRGLGELPHRLSDLL